MWGEQRWGGSQQSDRCGGWTAAKRRPIIPQQSRRLNTRERDVKKTTTKKLSR